MTTKEQERKALEQIRKIVAGLGENSYIATAFDGAFEIAEANIRDDFANSVNGMLDSRDQMIENLKSELRVAEASRKAGEKELARIERLQEVINQNHAAEIEAYQKRELSYDAKRRIYGLLQEALENDIKTMSGCAEDMAFFDPSDIAFTSAVEAYKKARNHKIDCEAAVQAIDKSING